MFIYLLYKNLNANVNRYISPILSLHIPHQFKFQACGHLGNLFSCCPALFLPTPHDFLCLFTVLQVAAISFLRKKERLPSLFPSQRCDAFVTQLFLVLSLGSCSDLSVMKTLCTSASQPSIYKTSRSSSSDIGHFSWQYLKMLLG